jgi:hypothetical protein
LKKRVKLKIFKFILINLKLSRFWNLSIKQHHLYFSFFSNSSWSRFVDQQLKNGFRLSFNLSTSSIVSGKWEPSVSGSKKDSCQSYKTFFLHCWQRGKISLLVLELTVILLRTMIIVSSRSEALLNLGLFKNYFSIIICKMMMPAAPFATTCAYGLSEVYFV